MFKTESNKILSQGLSCQLSEHCFLFGIVGGDIALYDLSNGQFAFAQPLSCKTFSLEDKNFYTSSHPLAGEHIKETLVVIKYLICIFIFKSHISQVSQHQSRHRDAPWLILDASLCESRVSQWLYHLTRKEALLRSFEHLQA